jgi:hypothetical protein
MRRLLALIVLALSLAMASGPAFAVPKADCPMSASGQVQAGHEDMDCCQESCAPECAAICPGAVMPFLGRSPAPADPIRDRLAMTHMEALHSADLSGADPPPRTTFS